VGFSTLLFLKHLGGGGVKIHNLENFAKISDFSKFSNVKININFVVFDVNESKIEHKFHILKDFCIFILRLFNLRVIPWNVQQQQQQKNRKKTYEFHLWKIHKTTVCRRFTFENRSRRFVFIKHHRIKDLKRKKNSEKKKIGKKVICLTPFCRGCIGLSLALGLAGKVSQKKKQ
jgi:hypothetical protein